MFLLQRRPPGLTWGWVVHQAWSRLMPMQEFSASKLELHQSSCFNVVHLVWLGLCLVDLGPPGLTWGWVGSGLLQHQWRSDCQWRRCVGQGSTTKDQASRIRGQDQGSVRIPRHWGGQDASLGLSIRLLETENVNRDHLVHAAIKVSIITIFIRLRFKFQLYEIKCVVYTLQCSFNLYNLY